MCVLIIIIIIIRFLIPHVPSRTTCGCSISDSEAMSNTDYEHEALGFHNSSHNINMLPMTMNMECETLISKPTYKQLILISFVEQAQGSGTTTHRSE